MTDKQVYTEEVGTSNISKTYKKTTCRDIYITVAYKSDAPKKIDYIRIHSTNKVSGCPVSFMESIADLLTFSIRRIRNFHESKAIIKNFRHQKCLNCPPNKEHITSCADAIGQVLEEVLKIEEEEKETKAP